MKDIKGTEPGFLPPRREPDEKVHKGEKVRDTVEENNLRAFSLCCCSGGEGKCPFA